MTSLPPLSRSGTAISSASRSGWYSGPIMAAAVTVIRRVASSTAPATVNGAGSQLSPDPWCSSVCTVVTPRSSAQAAISRAAR
ncbi:hypothetical protein SUDANB70_01662 [Streptomyces sp. enrichment culture]